MDGGRHSVHLVLIRQVPYVHGIQVSDVVHILLSCQRGQGVAQSIESLADVWVHVDIDPTHLPQHVERPGASTTAFC